MNGRTYEKHVVGRGRDMRGLDVQEVFFIYEESSQVYVASVLASGCT